MHVIKVFVLFLYWSIPLDMLGIGKVVLFSILSAAFERCRLMILCPDLWSLILSPLLYSNTYRLPKLWYIFFMNSVMTRLMLQLRPSKWLLLKWPPISFGPLTFFGPKKFGLQKICSPINMGSKKFVPQWKSSGVHISRAKMRSGTILALITVKFLWFLILSSKP